MEITKISPMKIDVGVISESTVVCELKIKGTKNPIKVNIDLHIYCKHPIHRNMTDVITSGIQSIHTSSNDSIHKIKMKIPQFNDRIKSCVYVSIDSNEGPYEKIYILSITVEDMRATDMNSSSRPQIYAHPQASMAVPNTEPKVSLSPPNTILPNTIPNGDRTINEWHDKIMIVSTWDTNCGIAIYTKDLLDDLEKICPGSFIVRRVESSNHLGAKLVHLQHEFSIVPKPPIVGGKVVITWHTITRDISNTMRIFESNLDVVAHIIPCNDAREYIQTSKDIFVVELGSKQMEQIKKEDARKNLGIDNIKKPIGFVFGFQSPNKNYNRLINAARNTGIHLIISGSTHFSGYKSNVSNDESVTFLNRYLTEGEIDLFALASDILLFDYADQDHYSCSSALHRTIGAGRPVVCANTKHFRDIHNVPKFSNQQELEQSIKYALENQESLGKYSLEYTDLTSRESIARRHMEIYRKYVNI